MSEIDELKSRFQRLLELRDRRDKDKKTSAASERAYRECEAEVFEAVQDSGMKGRISFDFGGELGRASFQTRSTNYGRILDKDAAIRALKAEGLDEMITSEAIVERRLNELVRDRLESTADLPDGVGWYPRNGISISRK